MQLFIQENQVFLDFSALLFCDRLGDQISCTEQFIYAKHLLTEVLEGALDFTESAHKNKSGVWR